MGTRYEEGDKVTAKPDVNSIPDGTLTVEEVREPESDSPDYILSFGKYKEVAAKASEIEKIENSRPDDGRHTFYNCDPFHQITVIVKDGRAISGTAEDPTGVYDFTVNAGGRVKLDYMHNDPPSTRNIEHKLRKEGLIQ